MNSEAPIIVSRNQFNWCARCPDLGLVRFGVTRGQAERRLRDAIAALPEPKKPYQPQPGDYSDDRPIFTVDRPGRAEQQESGRLNAEAHRMYGK